MFPCHCLHLCLVLVSVIVSTCVSFGSVYLGFCFVSSLCLVITATTLCPCVYPVCFPFQVLNPFVFDHACWLIPYIWVQPHLTSWHQATKRYIVSSHIKKKRNSWSCISNKPQTYQQINTTLFTALHHGNWPAIGAFDFMPAATCSPADLKQPMAFQLQGCRLQNSFVLLFVAHKSEENISKFKCACETRWCHLIGWSGSQKHFVNLDLQKEYCQ